MERGDIGQNGGFAKRDRCRIRSGTSKTPKNRANSITTGSLSVLGGVEIPNQATGIRDLWEAG